MREPANPSKSDRRIIVYAIAITLCVFLGPFGSSEQLGFWDRAIYWTVAIIAVGLLVETCVASALQSSLLGRLHYMYRVFVGACIGAFPGAATIFFINQTMRPDHLESTQFPFLWAQVSIMAIIISFFDLYSMPRETRERRIYGMSGQTRDAPVSLAATSAPIERPPTAFSQPRLMERLPSHLRLSQVISLSMQDHYVEVTTTKGSEMLLMRLSDAVDLLDGLPGAQTHRSHWAAQSHAQAMTRAGRKQSLTLSDGRTLPVSKSYAEPVQAMLDKKGQT